MDNATLTLHEYQDALVELPVDDIEYIRTALRNRIAISRPLDGRGLLLNPMQHAGVVVLPSGRRLECRPKVPVRNFFTMLAVAFDLEPEFLHVSSTFQRIDEIFEFVIRYFADLVDERIHLGLFRSYAEREESLAAVRGRIAIEEDLRRNHVTRHLTHCRFTEFTWDIPENQVIRQVVHMASRWATTRSLRGYLHLLDHRLSEISPVAFPATVLDRFTYHRLNDDYRPIHRLCKLFLSGSGLSEEAGQFDFRTFLFDMNDLFERFVTNLLRVQLPSEYQIKAQYRVTLGSNGELPMYPDIVLIRAGRPVLVIDCKYKRISPDEFKNHDVYQVVAYCTALAVRNGLLIYPRHEGDLDTGFTVRQSSIRVRHASIDLGAPPSLFWTQCTTFATRTLTASLPNLAGIA